MQKRKFPINNEFYEQGNDVLLGSMLDLATFQPEEQKLYLERKKFRDNKDDIMKMCGWKSRKSCYNNLEILKDLGLVQESELSVGSKKTPVYLFD